MGGVSSVPGDIPFTQGPSKLNSTGFMYSLHKTQNSRTETKPKELRLNKKPVVFLGHLVSNKACQLIQIR